MKRILWSIVIVLLTFLAFLPIGIDRTVTSGEYTVHSGETIHGGMFISSPGVVTIEEGARVDGSVFMGSGVLYLNGEISGGLFSLSGEVHTGPNAVVNGHATVTSVPFEPNPSTQINKNVTADVAGWMGGPIGTAIVLLVLTFYLVFGADIASLLFRRQVHAASEASRANRRAVLLTGATLLVALGALLLTRSFGVEIDQTVFSLFLLAPGLALFGVMLILGPQDSPMAVTASVLVMTGAVTLYQGLSGNWESWAFAWALILPAAVGFGRVIEGWWGQNSQRMNEGVKLTTIGLVIFAAAWIFFEVIIPATENSLMILGALLLIAAGIYLFANRTRRASGRLTRA